MLCHRMAKGMSVASRPTTTTTTTLAFEAAVSTKRYGPVLLGHWLAERMPAPEGNPMTQASGAAAKTKQGKPALVGHRMAQGIADTWWWME